MHDAKQLREPFLRLSKREDLSMGRKIAVRLAAVVLALIVCGILILSITGMNPITVYVTMISGAFGTRSRVWSTVKEMMMLSCIAVGLAPAFKMRFWNIGAEGQVLIGGIVTAACMINLKDLPAPLLFLAMAVGSVLAGAVWALLPALFKAKWNTNETLFTLMMNYVAIQLTSFFVAKWENPYGSNTVGIINQSTQQGWFPQIAGSRYFCNAVLVLLLAVLMHIYLKYTKHGYEIAVVGASENTARYAGINVGWVMIRTMLLSGAICGLAGFMAVAGASHTISVSTAGGRGFTAIIVAWLAKFDSATMLLISLLLAFLQNGAGEIASKCKLNDYASQMIIGIILFFILGSEFFINYRMIFRGSKKKEV
ncbi:MAG: ABC transporter permease [Lachnospiraceae bacterium]|nr:ABC transporter permease [Lachnospiraceae bacterium]